MTAHLRDHYFGDVLDIRHMKCRTHAAHAAPCAFHVGVACRHLTPPADSVGHMQPCKANNCKHIRNILGLAAARVLLHDNDALQSDSDDSDGNRGAARVRAQRTLRAPRAERRSVRRARLNGGGGAAVQSAQVHWAARHGTGLEAGQRSDKESAGDRRSEHDIHGSGINSAAAGGESANESPDGNAALVQQLHDVLH